MLLQFKHFFFYSSGVPGLCVYYMGELYSYTSSYACYPINKYNSLIKDQNIFYIKTEIISVSVILLLNYPLKPLKTYEDSML